MFLNYSSWDFTGTINELNRKHEMFLNREVVYLFKPKGKLNRKHEMFLNVGSNAKRSIRIKLNRKHEMFLNIKK